MDLILCLVYKKNYIYRVYLCSNHKENTMVKKMKLVKARNMETIRLFELLTPQGRVSGLNSTHKQFYTIQY